MNISQKVIKERKREVIEAILDMKQKEVHRLRARIPIEYASEFCLYRASKKKFHDELDAYSTLWVQMLDDDEEWTYKIGEEVANGIYTYWIQNEKKDYTFQRLDVKEVEEYILGGAAVMIKSENIEYEYGRTSPSFRLNGAIISSLELRHVMSYAGYREILFESEQEYGLFVE
ncbi:hypothetical protein [Priestia filamentosa]|uniref:Uncharacterized protein n=1 Tax=Priestia filamentosa TaxID=1402861 RepID=A0A1X7EXV3_9BACI|nr:hypothetical protein [Priestia filamentosa]AKO91435.1 hypothetical protein BEH_04565 [Priestia filamentosa]MDT3761521.1 hypothetical protein [Priestia filamentosa]OXS67626.1 hypothetical protein B1B01_13680 [Priestia filamentosa]WCM16629.1 hypothetical protein PGN40_04580 [Priestia filamentosa]WRU96050.1 hypothetical protein RYX51_02900 [Priestia filamentosa]